MVGQFRRQVEGGGEGPPNMDTILVTAEEIATGMAFLHSQGIVHGDLTGGERQVLACVYAWVCMGRLEP